MLKSACRENVKQSSIVDKCSKAAFAHSNSYPDDDDDLAVEEPPSLLLWIHV